jgi:DNA polymerase-3 subunit alpha
MKFEKYDLGIHGLKLPVVDAPTPDHYGYLRDLCYKGLAQRLESGIIAKSKEQDYKDRIEKELKVINTGGFVDYIILIFDIIRFCKENNIPKGQARGSCAGCLILYLIGVTDVDSIKHDLYFERFLSEARIKKIEVGGEIFLDGSLVPDVDLDICRDNRARVVEYLLNKYKGKSCKLSTFATLTGKILIKECGKIVGEYSEQQMNEISALIPTLFGKVKTLDEAQEESEDFKAFCQNNPEVYRTAKKLSGLIKNKGSHASGYLISYYPTEKYIPLELGTDDEIVSAYDMNDASKVAIKVDLLGLDGVTLMSNICKRIGVDLYDLNYNDPSIYKACEDLITPYGLFQISGDCNFRVLNKVKPRNLYELSVVIALGRPGALAYVDQFAEYVKSGDFQSVHEFFDDVLKKTGGIPVFQEQTMKMTNKIGFTLDEAETLRRIIGKKKVDQMPVWEQKVRDKVTENKLDPKTADVLWKVLDDSKSYSFNASHSISYAILAACSIYLKLKHPIEFFIESLKISRAKQDPLSEISQIQKELLYFGIKLLPPDLVLSDLDFKEENGNIRYGLSAIKGVSEKTFEKLKTFLDTEKPNKFQAFQAAKSAGLNIGILSALIQAGALSSQGEDRTKLVYEAQLFNLLTDKEKTWTLANGERFNYDLFSILALVKKDVNSCLDIKNKPVFKATRLETLNKKAEKYREIFKKNSQYKEFAAYMYERKLTGYSYSHKLVDVFKGKTPHELSNVYELKGLFEGDKVNVVGFVKEVMKSTSKKGKKYCKIVLEDETAAQDLLLFDPNFSDAEKENLIPKEEEVVIIRVKAWKDTMVVDKILALNNDKVYLKLADLKADKNEEENLKTTEKKV